MGLKKFKSFKLAGEDAFEEFYQNRFDPARARAFFAGFTGQNKSPYEPGLYKFTSFVSAREYDFKKIIEKSAFVRGK